MAGSLKPLFLTKQTNIERALKNLSASCNKTKGEGGPRRFDITDKRDAVNGGAKVNQGKPSYMMVKDYNCPWWNPDPSTGVLSPHSPSTQPHVDCSIDTHVWFRHE